MVRSDEVIELPLTIDEALKFTVSGGVIMPMSQKLPASGGADKRRGPSREQLGLDKEIPE
jgi:uncharacterized membrane protein